MHRLTLIWIINLLYQIIRYLFKKTRGWGRMVSNPFSQINKFVHLSPPSFSPTLLNFWICLAIWYLLSFLFWQSFNWTRTDELKYQVKSYGKFRMFPIDSCCNYKFSNWHQIFVTLKNHFNLKCGGRWHFEMSTACCFMKCKLMEMLLGKRSPILQLIL